MDLEIFGLEGIPEGDRIAHELAIQGEFSWSLYTVCVYHNRSAANTFIVLLILHLDILL